MLTTERTASAVGHSVSSGMGWEVATDVVCLPLSIVNVYFLGERRAPDRHWVLVDAGLRWSAAAIRRAAARRFGPGSRPGAIVLTHGHFDHIGVAQELSDYWDVPIYAHRLELPYITGQSAYPPPDPAVGGGAMSLLSRFYPRGPFDLGDRIGRLPDDGTVPAAPEWRWIATPGHSPGHVAFFRDADRTLIAGDAFVTQHQESLWGVLTQKKAVCRPPAYYTTDWPQARRSVETLAQLQPQVAATGHGIPMRGKDLQHGLDLLVREWNRLALPSYGRYVTAPAIANERGTVAIPPPVIDLQLVKVLGGAMAAWVLYLALCEARSRSTRD